MPSGEPTESNLSQKKRNPLSATLRRKLRARFGLFPLYEVKNRALLGPRTVELRRFENAEVARLRDALGEVPRAECVTVMPTFRRPDLLVDAVDSALAQSFEDNIVIVVDDGGGLPPLRDHPRLRAVSLSRNTKVLGLVRNVGIRLTDSTFIAFLDDDNRWKPNHLETAIAALRGRPIDHDSADTTPLDIVYTAVERRLPDGTFYDVLSKSFDRKGVASGAWIDANSVVARRDPRTLFSRLPRVSATLPKEDWEFVYRLSRSRRVAHVPTPTVEYLINDTSYYRERPAEWVQRARAGAAASAATSAAVDESIN